MQRLFATPTERQLHALRSFGVLDAVLLEEWSRGLRTTLVIIYFQVFHGS